INVAKRFLPDLIAGKSIQHPRMGVGLQDITPAIASSLKLSNVQQGVQITSIDSSSAAAKAGLRGGTGVGRSTTIGDVIVAIDNHEVKNFNDLANYIDSKNVGDKVSLKIVRDGKDQTVDLTLDAWQG